MTRDLYSREAVDSYVRRNVEQIAGLVGEPIAVARQKLSEMSGALIGGGVKTTEMQFDPRTGSMLVDMSVDGAPLPRLAIEVSRVAPGARRRKWG